MSLRRGQYRRAPYAGLQKLLYGLPLDYVADPRVDFPKYLGTPYILWVAGDGNIPWFWRGARNTNVVFSLSGSTSLAPGPYQLRNGSDQILEILPGSARRQSDVDIDPPLTEDLVVFGFTSMNLSDVLFSTGAALGGPGYRLQRMSSENSIRIRVNGDTDLSLTLADVATGDKVLFPFCIVVDRDGDTKFMAGDSTNFDSAATPAGEIGDGSGLAIGALLDGGNNLLGSAGYLGIWHGVGIADPWNAGLSELAFSLATGIRPTHGALSAFTRDSHATWEDRNGVTRIASVDMPRAGDSGGHRIAPARINNCARNIDHDDTTGYTGHGGVLTAEGDSGKLESAGFGSLGTRVLKYVAGSGHVYNNIQIGNTNENAFSIVARGASGGESLDLGYHTDAEPGVFTNLRTIVLTAEYQRYIIVGTPGNATDHWAIRGGAATYYFTASQVEEGAVATSIITNWATGAGASRDEESLALPIGPADAKGKITLGFTPLGWSSGDTVAGQNSSIVSTGGVAALRIRGTSGRIRFGDGSSDVDGPVMTSGIRYEVEIGWGRGGIYISVDGSEDREDYDGAYNPDTENFILLASAYEASVDNVQVWKEA